VFLANVVSIRGFKLPGWAGVKNPMTHGYTVGDM
jgi:hypothetical protein